MTGMTSALIAATAALAAASVPSTTELTVPGPQGAIAGTLVDPGGKGPAIVIIPGSGPTDRDGDNPLGVKAASYRLLAAALAARGIATLRADKRGLFGSKAAMADPSAVTIADYAADAHAWAGLVAARSGRPCVWLLGHSEGGLIALAAAQDPTGLCGIILVSAPGRPLGMVLREQFKANPANAPILTAALGMIDSLEAGRPVDPATLPPPLGQLFPTAVQPFMIDLFAHDPAKLAASVRLPILIVQGERDIQIGVYDAQALAAAAPAARLVLLPGVNHVLKSVATDDRAANLATYGDPALPIAPAVIDAVAAFVAEKR
ncbi:alpha/beta hydrolase [Sphingomonas sp. ERG5]|uniref:alpha/beta hydrolase n=1 Tax=Sphingomonas sp. ERG5 TaxID=1381597 RepID=UPI00054BEEE5|nr:alpha/beta fold hydrolase [Sphingomonas sp. ERG5]